MNELWPFIKAVGRHWWALMSCAIFTGLGVFIAWANESSAWAVEASLAAAAICVFIACYLAWRDEHKLLIAERAINQRPSLHGEITHAFIGPTHPFQKSDPVYRNSVILLDVKVWNIIQMPEITVLDYELTVRPETPGQDAQTFVGTQEGWRIRRAVPPDGGEVNYDLKSSVLRPIAYGAPRLGQVGFYIENLDSIRTNSADLELILVDALGGRNSIPASKKKLIKGRIEGYWHPAY